MPDTMSLADRVAQYPWFHSIDLGNGVVTNGHKTLDGLRRESAALFDAVDLKGQSVIDIGAWNGGHSLDAKRRSAARVAAADHYVWNDPYFRGRETFDLVRDILNVDIEAIDIEVADLDPSRVGTFDVVLFAGVFYHLFDPIDGLMRAARLAREVLIVESQVDLHDMTRPAMVFYPGRELMNDPTNWWGPNPLCLHALLMQLGFERVDVKYSAMTRDRAILHAWRTTKLRLSGPDEGVAIDPAAPAGGAPQTPPPGRRQKIRTGARLILEGLGLR